MRVSGKKRTVVKDSSQWRGWIRIEVFPCEIAMTVTHPPSNRTSKPFVHVRRSPRHSIDPDIHVFLAILSRYSRFYLWSQQNGITVLINYQNNISTCSQLCAHSSCGISNEQNAGVLAVKQRSCKRFFDVMDPNPFYQCPAKNKYVVF